MNTQKRPRILVGVSGSRASLAALRWAAYEAERQQGLLRAVLIWAPEQRASYARAVGGADAPQAHERARRTLADTLRTVLGPGPLANTTAEVMEGAAERVLVAESAEADLLVLGSTAPLTSLRSIGPVVRTCLSLARCPVVVVSAANFPLDLRPQPDPASEPTQRDDDRFALAADVVQARGSGG